MGPKVFQITAILCGTLGCILICVAMASSSWLVGCVQYDNIFSAIRNSPSVDESVKSDLETSAAILKGVSLCFHQGIFKFTMKTGPLIDMSVGIQITSIPRSSLFGSFGLIFSLVYAVTGAVLLLVATTCDNEDYTAKCKASKLTRQAMIVLILAGLAGIGGMAIYSGGSAQAASDPIMFFAHIGQTMGSQLKEMTSKLPKLTPFGGRGKRNIDISSLGLSSEQKDFLNTYTQGLHPAYGYAFFLGWFAVALMIISAILAAIARKYLFDLPYSGGGDSVKL